MTQKQKSEFHGYINPKNNIIVKPIDVEIKQDEKYLKPVEKETIGEAKTHYKGHHYDKKVKHLKKEISELKKSLARSVEEVVSLEDDYNKVYKDNLSLLDTTRKKVEEAKNLKQVCYVSLFGFIVVAIQFFLK